MSLTAVERIIAAVELNPDRPRVTLRRDDVRAMLADNQRQAADIDFMATSAVRAGEMLAQHCAIREGLERELATTRDDHEHAQGIAKHWREKAGEAHATLFDAAWIIPRAWMLYAASAFAGFLAHG